MHESKIDWPSFIATVAVILIVCIPLAMAGDKAAAFLQEVYNFISHQFGILYLLAAVGTVGFLTWLGLSRFGDVRLGDEEVEFSQMSWIAMLFCAGIGAGLMYWCVIEWTYYYDAPPFGVAAHSAEAAEWASTYGMFHWGITAWAFYCLPAIAIAYPYYNRKLDILRFSVSCNWLLKGNNHGPMARVIDFLFHDCHDCRRRDRSRPVDADDRRMPRVDVRHRGEPSSCSSLSWRFASRCSYSVSGSVCRRASSA